MALPKKYDFNDYDNYITEPNPTTSAEAQSYFRNTDSLVGALVDAFLWQPETNYKNGDVVKSPSMPNGAEAVCVSINGGKSSNVEPQWGNVGGENIADGTCFWKLRWKHWSKDVIPIEKGGTGATTGAAARKKLEVTIKTYSSVSDFGLDSNAATIEEICKAMPEGSQLQMFANTTDNKGIVVPVGAWYGMLFAQKQGGRTKYYLYDENNRYNYYGSVKDLENGIINLKRMADYDVVPVGTIISYAGNATPSGFLDCSGAELNPNTYASLFGVIGTTYGGDGVTTFNLPNLNNNSFLEGSNTVGTVKSAGLPNVKGSVSEFRFKTTNSPQTSGAFGSAGVADDTYLAGADSSYASKSSAFTFDAKRYSSVYRDDIDTVQPKSVTVKFCIKY